MNINLNIGIRGGLSPLNSLQNFGLTPTQNLGFNLTDKIGFSRELFDRGGSNPLLSALSSPQIGFNNGFGSIPGFGSACNPAGSMFGGMMQMLNNQTQMINMMMMVMMSMLQKQSANGFANLAKALGGGLGNGLGNALSGLGNGLSGLGNGLSGLGNFGNPVSASGGGNSSAPAAGAASSVPSSNGNISGKKMGQAKGTGYYPYNNAMEGGYNDMRGKKLCTLQDYLSGKAPYVSIALDKKLYKSGQIKYGDTFRIPELEKKYGKKIIFKAVDTGGAFTNKGFSRVDICTANSKASCDPAVNGNLTLIKV